MPASARAAISTFRELRTTHSVVVTEVTSEWGWLIWTPMKISPAATAATAGRPDEGGRCDGHVRSLSGWSVAVAAGMSGT